MNILVATSDVPFTEGGHRVIAEALVQALREAGHAAEIIKTPQNRFGRQFGAYLATRLTDVEFTGSGEQVHRLISIRFPSYALRHSYHVCWLNHRMREYYDLWHHWSARLSRKGKFKESLRRRLIHTADRYFLKRNVRKVFAQSKNIQQSLLQWGNIPSQVLYPPPPQRNYRTEGYEDFVLSPARLTPLKRVSLLIRAMAKTGNGRAIIAGNGPERSALQDLVRELDLQNRVEMVGHISDDQLARLYGKCRAVFYAPVNEDFGMVTTESFICRKPVITAADSGGPMELVQDGVNGFVVRPLAEEISERLIRLFDDEGLAQKLGNAGFEYCRSVTWPETVRRLLE